MRAYWADPLPEKGELPAVHPGTEGQAGVLSERGYNTREHQCQEDKAGWQHNLPERGTRGGAEL